MKSHATHAARARNKRESSVDFARILRGFCVGFARNLILFLFEREREGYKRFADCTVPRSYGNSQRKCITSFLYLNTCSAVVYLLELLSAFMCTERCTFKLKHYK